MSGGLFIYSIIYYRQSRGVEKEIEITLPSLVKGFLFVWVLLGLITFVSVIAGLFVGLIKLA